MCSLLSKFRYLSTTEESFWLYSEFLSYIRFSYVAKFLLSLYWVPPIWAISYGFSIWYILIWHVMTPSYIIQAIGDCTTQNWISYIDVAGGCLRQSMSMTRFGYCRQHYITNIIISATSLKQLKIYVKPYHIIWDL